MKQQRCSWAEGSELMTEYHDTEWGVPSHDDQHLFEMLMLEGAQAGLSWSIVLNKREGYRKAFANFDIQKVSKFGEAKTEKLMLDPSIVRNRLKIASGAINANALIAVQKEFGSFSEYLWGWVNGQTIVNRPKPALGLPTHDQLSDALSKDLKKRGFKFIGTTIIYSYLQAVGLIDDHFVNCPCKPAR